MSDPLVREQSPTEFFKELVESALARQHVHAADLTEYYLVNLLCRTFASIGASDGALAAIPASTTTSRSRCAWPAPSRAPVSSSGSGCVRSAISRSSCPASSRTASPAAASTSTTTSRWASTPTVRSAAPTTKRLPTSSGNWRASSWVSGCARRHQRAHRAGASVDERRPASLREVAPHRQPARRPAAPRAGHPPEPVDRPPLHAVELATPAGERSISWPR